MGLATRAARSFPATTATRPCRWRCSLAFPQPQPQAAQALAAAELTPTPPAGSAAPNWLRCARDDADEHNYVPPLAAKANAIAPSMPRPVRGGDGRSAERADHGRPGPVVRRCAEGFEGVELMRCGQLEPHGDGAEIWQRFAADGSVPEEQQRPAQRQGDPRRGDGLRFGSPLARSWSCRW